MAIQVRRGNESDFDASKMLPGEWAVSLDTRYVRMCFAPGIVLRMSTYDAFEADMVQIQAILAECRNIQSAVQRIQTEVNSKASLTVEYANSAKESADRAYSEADRAKTYADNAEAVTGVQIATKDRAGLIKGGNNHIAEDGTLMLITTTDSTTQPNSHAGREMVLEIGGAESEQETTVGKNIYPNGDISIPSANTYQGFQIIALSAKEDWVIGKTYTVSFVTDTAFKYTVLKADGMANIQASAGVRNSVTFKVAYSTSASAIMFASAVNANVNITDIMIEESEQLTSYEQYTGGQPAPNPSYPQEIKKSVVSGVRTHRKNFFNPNSPIKKGYWSDTNAFNASSVWNYYEHKVSQNTDYTISGRNAISTSVLIVGMDDSGAVLYNFGHTNRTFNSGNATVIGYSVQETDFTTCQFEEGTVATPYEPYTESSYTFSQPIELYGMGDVQDVITPQEIEKKYYSVSASVLSQFDSANLLGYITLPNGIAKITDWDYPYENVMCNMFSEVLSRNKIISNKNINGLAIAVSSNGNATIIFRIVDIEQTEEAYNAFLANTPLEVVFEMATPTTETLPIADQIGLNSLATYDGITYVEFIYERLEPTFRGKYGTSEVGGMTLESLLVARNNELKQELANERLLALEASVVNNI